MSAQDSHGSTVEIGSRPRWRPTVSVDVRSGCWFLGDRQRDGNGVGQIVARRDDLIHCTAADLHRALLRSESYGHGDTLLVTDVEEAFYDADDNLVSGACFELHDGALTLDVSFLVDQYEDEQAQTCLVTKVLTPLLVRHRMTLLECGLDGGSVQPPWLWHARLGFRTRGRNLYALHQVGLDVMALMEAMGTGNLNRITAGDLVRGGNAHVLINQPEGHWLDVKSQHYDLSTDHGEIALAQAVTRFCNAELGGLVVVGMRTKRVPGGEQIRGLCPVPPDARMVRRYEQTIERRVYPPPDGMTVESIPSGDGMFVLIDIPPQPEELKPFLVHGAIVDGRTEGAFISIVRRRGESSIPITAPMIHSTLAAGRALLRRGELPSDPP